MTTYVTKKVRERLGPEPINGWSLRVAKKNGSQVDAEFVKDEERRLVVVSGDALASDFPLRTLVEPHLQ